MKKSIVMILVIAIICFGFVGCASLTSPAAVTANPVGSKVGQASGKIWFGIFGTADAGIQAAAKNGGITTVSTVDFTTKAGILGLWTEYTATVTGE